MAFEEVKLDKQNKLLERYFQEKTGQHRIETTEQFLKQKLFQHFQKEFEKYSSANE
jgi:hypothetical protein